ncbi:MAG: hypothetical protein OHK0012_25510 [Synechococcales cyanobacterium]
METTDLKQKHVLVVDDSEGRRAFVLTAVGYTLGRDDTAAIMLQAEGVSRQQAVLVRIPGTQPDQFSYRLVDGNTEGKHSTNGTTVNGKPCLSHDLQDGDVICFAGTAKALYCLRTMTEEQWQRYTETVDYRPMNVKPINPDSTTLF